MKKILSEIYHETFTVKSRSDHLKEEYIQAVDRSVEYARGTALQGAAGGDSRAV